MGVYFCKGVGSDTGIGWVLARIGSTYGAVEFFAFADCTFAISSVYWRQFALGVFRDCIYLQGVLEFSLRLYLGVTIPMCYSKKGGVIHIALSRAEHT